MIFFALCKYYKVICRTLNKLLLWSSIFVGKGKGDWPDSESDKELKIEASDEEDIIKPVVKSKSKITSSTYCITPKLILR